MAVQQAVRVFRFNGIELPDPGAHMSPDQVRDLYSANFPELATAAVEGPTASGDRMAYEFRRAVGTKG
jgi:PRTRC genetic system protein C